MIQARRADRLPSCCGRAFRPRSTSVCASPRSQRLRPEEWASGTSHWLRLAAGDPRALQGLLGTLANTRFKDEPLWLELRSEGGAATVAALDQVLRSVSQSATVGAAQS